MSKPIVSLARQTNGKKSYWNGQHTQETNPRWLKVKSMHITQQQKRLMTQFSFALCALVSELTMQVGLSDRNASKIYLTNINYQLTTTLYLFILQNIMTPIKMQYEQG